MAMSTDHASNKVTTHNDIENLKVAQTGTVLRVTRVEDAINEIRDVVQGVDERFALINSKLDSLIAVQATLDAFKPSINGIVPRSVVEARTKVTED